MGLKVLTLALCSVTGKRVKVHGTKETAVVVAKYVNGNTQYSLRFDDGRIVPVKWSEDSQGYASSGVDLEEEEPDRRPTNEASPLMCC